MPNGCGLKFFASNYIVALRRARTGNFGERRYKNCVCKQGTLVMAAGNRGPDFANCMALYLLF